MDEAGNSSMEQSIIVKLPEYQLGREKVREFAAAIRNDHPAHWDLTTANNLGFNDVIAPITMVAVIAAQWQKQMFEKLLPDLDISKILHVEQKIVNNRALIAGDVLTVEAKVDSVKTLGPVQMIVVNSNLVDKVGKPAVAIFSTFATKTDLQVDGSMEELAKGVMKYGAI